MSNIIGELTKQKLSEIFGDRVCFDPVELSAYSKDLISVPNKLRKYIRATPEAVVQPETVEELQKLLELANQEKIALTPRGAGTSAFGGAIPTMAGIVIDMVRFKGIKEIDKLNKTVTVLSGTTMLQIEEYLLFRGMSLNLYPSSAPSATIGGWVAQGGCGYGSYSNQDIKSLIVEAQVLLPNGSLSSFSGREIDKIVGTFGTAGIILEVTFRIGERIKEEEVILVKGDSLRNFSKFITALKGISFDSLWSINFFCEKISEIKRSRSEHLNGSGGALLNVVFRNPRKEDVEGFLVLVQGCGLRVQEREVAQKEWSNRYNLLDISRVKRNLVAGEVIIPSEKLEKLQDFIAEELGDKMGIMGHYCGKDSIAVILIHLGDDLENNSWLKAIEANRIQKLGLKLGGKPYGTGLYFSHLAETYFGRDTLEAIWSWKKEVDPLAIMNPGKVFPETLDINSSAKELFKVLKYGRIADTILGKAGKYLANQSLSTKQTGVVCAKCGYCRHVCPVFRENPWESNNPRGKIFLLKQAQESQEIRDFINNKPTICLRCNRCIEFCQVQNEGWFANQS